MLERIVTLDELQKGETVNVLLNKEPLSDILVFSLNHFQRFCQSYMVKFLLLLCHNLIQQSNVFFRLRIDVFLGFVVHN